jgi:hypothetical protein
MTGKEKEKKLSTKQTAIGVIVVLILILGFAFGIVWWGYMENQKMLDKGCTPSAASNYLGNPTFWSCPNTDNNNNSFASILKQECVKEIERMGYEATETRVDLCVKIGLASRNK